MVSALGAIPKSGSNKLRIIHDCSRPVGQALNDHATNDTFQYQTIQHAIDVIHPGSYMAKLDLSSAFRYVKIHPTNHEATGLKWTFSGDSEPTYLIDSRLPFGASRSPQIFNDVTQAVCRIMRHNGYNNVIVYLDDFLVISDSFDECNQILHVLLRLLRKLGFAINYEKLVCPTQRITFLGIILDSIKMSMELPMNKLVDLKFVLLNIMKRQKITKRALQSLAGKLSWATQCIYGGKFHLRRILDKITLLRLPWHRTRVTNDMREDINWWLQFMDIFNGTVPLVDKRPTTPVYIDACPVAGGAYYESQFVYTPWDTWSDAQNLHINFKEALSLEPAIAQWANQMSNKKVIVHCDNQAAVSMINKGSSRNQTVMSSLRRIFWWSAVFNFRLQAVYIPGSQNNMADRISRLHEHSSRHFHERLYVTNYTTSLYR